MKKKNLYKLEKGAFILKRHIYVYLNTVYFLFDNLQKCVRETIIKTYKEKLE